jgi:hypothetical protein
MKDAQESLRKHRAARMAKSEHIQPVLVSAGPPSKIGVLGKIKLASQALKTYNTAKYNNFAMNSKSLKTTLFGSGGFIVLAANVASMLLDGDPHTNPDWSVIIPLAISNLGLLFAKDFNATHTTGSK